MKNTVWQVLLYNIVCVICWTILSIVFNKWWIALFAILFMSCCTVKRYYRYCDGCGKLSPYADSYNEAIEKAKESGWMHIEELNEDYCPKCKLKRCNI